MNKRGFLDMDEEFLVALGLGLCGGFISLFVIKSVDLGLFWKIATFLVSTIVGTFATQFILNK